MSLFKDKLKEDVRLERIDRSLRVGHQPEQPDENGRQCHRPIIVQFATASLRRKNSSRVVESPSEVPGCLLTAGVKGSCQVLPDSEFMFKLRASFYCTYLCK